MVGRLLKVTFWWGDTPPLAMGVGLERLPEGYTIRTTINNNNPPTRTTRTNNTGGGGCRTTTTNTVRRIIQYELGEAARGLHNNKK